MACQHRGPFAAGIVPCLHPPGRTAFRDFNHPDYANDNYGFRLAVGER